MKVLLAFLLITGISFSQEFADSDLNEPTVGLALMSLDEYAKYADGDPTLPQIKRKGAVVVGVLPFSPGAVAGIKELDLIATINGSPAISHAQLTEAVEAAKTTGEIALSVAPVATGVKRSSWGTAKKKSLKPRSVGYVAKEAMEVNRDEVSGHSWVRHRDDSKFDVPTDIRLYFELNDNKATNLRSQLFYVGDDWLFAQAITFQAGEKRETAKIDYFEWDRDVRDAGVLTEVADVPIPAPVLHALRTVIGEPRVTFRLTGKEGVADRTLTMAEKIQLHQTLDAFRALGGTFPK